MAVFYFNTPVPQLTFKTTILQSFLQDCCFKGFTSNNGTASVGLAANSAVVTASVWIIIIDAIVVQVTNSILYS